MLPCFVVVVFSVVGGGMMFYVCNWKFHFSCLFAFIY